MKYEPQIDSVGFSDSRGTQFYIWKNTVDARDSVNDVYMHKDGSWHRYCGRENFWDTREEAQEWLNKYAKTKAQPAKKSIIIKKTLTGHGPLTQFFRGEELGYEISICGAFVSKNCEMKNVRKSITMEARSKNPKEKGWSTVSWLDSIYVTCKGKKFEVLYDTRALLKLYGLDDGKFWLKVEIA